MNAIKEAYHKRSLFPPDLVALADAAQALAHPARLAILLALVQRRACVCGEIVEVLPLSQPTVSRHLKELKDAGLIQGEVEGPRSCYCLSAVGIKQLENHLTGFLAQLKQTTQAIDAPADTCC